MDSTHTPPLDYISMIRRRRWWWITPIAASALIGWALVRYLPKEYRSTATIGVTAALVSPNLVGQSAPFDNQDRLRAISQQLLSAPVLARVVREDGAPAGDIDRRIEALRRAITITVPDPVAQTGEPRRLDTFVVAYSDAQPARAQRIANRVATVFVDESSKVRTERAEDTSAFIATQLSASEARVAEFEARLRKAKEGHMGELPEQTQTNVQTLAGLKQQTASNASALRAEQDHLSMIEREIDAFDRDRLDEPTGRAADGPPTPAARVAALERDLASAQAVYTEKHPEVLRLESELASARRDALIVHDQPAADRLAQLRRNPAYIQLVGDREMARARIKDLERATSDTQPLISLYQARIDAAPMVEQELSTIERDYDLEKQQYAELSAKQHAAVIAANVERDRSGERFAMLEAATFPTAPVKPVPLRVMLGAMLAGLCVGAALTLGREYFDHSVHDERELKDTFDGVPVLGTITRIPA